MFHFRAPQEATCLKREGKRVVDVSSRASPPYNYLSPFYPHGNIPVPGLPEEVSDSVEGIWQGLKLARGCINSEFFKGQGRKRRCRPEGHKYNGEILGYRTARSLIYLPSYRWMVYNCPLAREAAVDLMWLGMKDDVFLHDVEENGDIEDISSPLAHAAVLAELLNENLHIFRRYAEDVEFRTAYDADHNGEPAYKLADILIQELKEAN